MENLEVCEELLPEWAIGLAHGKFVLGAHLATRDGRRMGNGHIIAINPAHWDETKEVFTVLTDAGNEARLTLEELNSSFYPPCWISDVDRVLKRFGTQDEGFA